MDAYTITLWVTLEQESAIKELFLTRQWLFQKSGPSPPVPAESSGSRVYDVELSIPTSTSTDHGSLCTAKNIQQPQNTLPIRANEEISKTTFTHGNDLTTESALNCGSTSEDLQSVLHDYETLSNVLSVNVMCQEQDKCLPAVKNGEQQLLFSSSFDEKLQSIVDITAVVGHVENAVEQNHNTSLRKDATQSEITDVFEEIGYESKGIPNAVDVLEKGVPYKDTIASDGMGLSDMLDNHLEEQEDVHDVDTVEDAFLKSVTDEIRRLKEIEKKLNDQSLISETIVDEKNCILYENSILNSSKLDTKAIDNVEKCTNEISALSNNRVDAKATVGAIDSDMIVKTEQESTEENTVASKTISKPQAKTKRRRRRISKLVNGDETKFQIYCEDCQHTFKYKRSYDKHKADNKCRHVCSICGKVFLFGSTARFKIHMMYHNKQKQHVCDVCGASYVEKHKLTQHMNKHTGNKPFMCDVCGFTFTSHANMYSHNQTHHPEPSDTRRYQCDQCPKVFQHFNGLLYHRKHYHRRDTDVQEPYQCKVCEKNFRTPDLLKRHETVHRDTKDFVCKICGAAFIRIQGLTEHKKRHAKEYAHFCMWCRKGFYSKSCLSAHARIHTGDKPYQCSTCDFQTAIKGNLTKHTKNKHNK